METVNKLFGSALIIGGMKFRNVNACAHRMLGIAHFFRRHCEKVFFLGVSNNEDHGVFESFEYDTIRYPKSFRSWVGFTFRAKDYLKAIDAHSGVKYVVVNGSVPSIPTLKIAKYCKKRGIVFVFDIGEWYTTNGSGVLRKAIKGLDTFLKMHRICKKYQNYIVASTFLANHCGSQKNVLVLPTLVTNRLVSAYKQPHDGFATNAIRLSFAGILEKNNEKECLDPLIGAIEKYNSNSRSLRYVLDVIGCKRADSAFVFYHGKRPYSDCIAQLVHSDFSVIPRGKTRKNQSGFPTKLSESFLYGVPVIATDTSDIGLYLINGVNGFLVPSNEETSYLRCFEAIADGMEKSPDYLDNLSANVRKHNKLTPDAFVESFDDFFDRLATR